MLRQCDIESHYWPNVTKTKYARIKCTALKIDTNPMIDWPQASGFIQDTSFTL